MKQSSSIFLVSHRLQSSKRERTKGTHADFLAANSALTAQPTLELHTHGSPALTALLLQLLPTLGDDFRIAEPGSSSFPLFLSFDLTRRVQANSQGSHSKLAS